jgi:hypothetical protein
MDRKKFIADLYILPRDQGFVAMTDLIEASSLQMIQLYWNGSMQGARAGRTRLITP